MHDVLSPAAVLADELIHRREAGYDVEAIQHDVETALRSGSPEEIERARVRLEATELRPDWPHHEPSPLEEIPSTLLPRPNLPPVQLDGDDVPSSSNTACDA